MKQRTHRFALDCRKFVRGLPKSTINQVDGRQLVKASGSVGANYLEADNALGEKDFLMRVGICLKEAREAQYWLSLLESANASSGSLRQGLIKESDELVRIFAAMIRNKRSRM